MRNMSTEQWPVKKVSLQMKPTPTGKKPNSRRATLCYSANYKARTLAIQNKNLSNQQEYPQNFVSSNSHHDLCRRINKSEKAKGNRRIETCQNHINDNIEVNAKSLLIKSMPGSKPSSLPRATTHNLTELFQSFESKTLCKSGIIEKKRSEYTPTSRSFPARRRNQSCSEKRSNCSGKTKDKKNQSGTRGIYKTSHINLSGHFQKREMDFVGLPICKKLSISKLNKFYELCIQDLKQMTEGRRSLVAAKELKTEPICEFEKDKEVISPTKSNFKDVAGGVTGGRIVGNRAKNSLISKGSCENGVKMQKLELAVSRQKQRKEVGEDIPIKGWDDTGQERSVLDLNQI